MQEWTKLLLCIIEMMLIIILCMALPFTMIGIGYPALFNPFTGIISIIGTGLLAGDLIARACDGVGFSW